MPHYDEAPEARGTKRARPKRAPRIRGSAATKPPRIRGSAATQPAVAATKPPRIRGSAASGQQPLGHKFLQLHRSAARAAAATQSAATQSAATQSAATQSATTQSAACRGPFSFDASFIHAESGDVWTWRELCRLAEQQQPEAADAAAGRPSVLRSDLARISRLRARGLELEAAEAATDATAAAELRSFHGRIHARREAADARRRRC